MSRDADNADDGALFRDAVADARPLRAARVDLRPPPPPPRPVQAERDRAEVLEALLDLPPDPAAMETGEELIYQRAGVQRRVMQRLRRGHYLPAAHLDLHGLTRRQAYAEVVHFLADCRRRRLSCVRIVHGKGRGSNHRGPVLKGAVDQWLRLRDEVLAFASAPPGDGGTGAVYVLLRKPKGRS